MDELFEGLEGLGFDTNTVNSLVTKMEQEVVVKKEKEAKPFDIRDVLFDRTITCESCDMTFKERAVKPAKVRYIESDEDLCPKYEPLDPNLYSVVICPKCGYAALSQTFNKIGQSHIKLLKQEITPKYKYKQYPEVYTIDDAIERYKYALFVAVAIKSKDGEKGAICMRTAWLYKMKNDQANMALFEKNALSLFKNAYTKERFPIMGIDELTMQYVLGNYCFKQGILDEALKWLGGVITSKETNPRLKNRAIDLKEEIRKRH